MLQDIFDAIKNLVSFVLGIGDFILDTIRDLTYMVGVLQTVSGGITEYLSWLPPGFLLIIGVVISLVVIYKIVGREG